QNHHRIRVLPDYRPHPFHLHHRPPVAVIHVPRLVLLRTDIRYAPPVPHRQTPPRCVERHPLLAVRLLHLVHDIPRRIVIRRIRPDPPPVHERRAVPRIHVPHSV